jgi:hypothetical protein
MIWRNKEFKPKELIAQNQFILYLLVFFAAFFVYLWIQSTPSFLDPDSFYHLKMSRLILEQGPITNFPWLQFTVLKDYYIDHHFLYHVLTIPFIYFLGDFIGFKIYTVILASFFILLSFAIFKKIETPYPVIFSFLLLFSPAFMFRISLAKATAFSLILLFLGIYFLFRQRYFLLALIAFLYVWSYGGFLLLLGVSFIYVLANFIDRTFINKEMTNQPKEPQIFFKLKDWLWNFFKKIFSAGNIKAVLATLAGTVLGLILNPYFPKNLKFYWQQIVQIGLINYRGAVNVGGEWYPYKIMDLLSESGVVMIIGIISLILFVLFIKKQKTESIFFFITCLIFFIFTLKSKRYVEYFVPTLAYFSAYTISSILRDFSLNDFINDLKKDSFALGAMARTALIYILLIFPVIMAKDAYITRQSFIGGIPFDNFSGISNYLAQNTQPGEIIMQTDWDDFPMLFYYNSKDYYIVGLDPTFMYNYDPVLYNLFADITTAKKTDNLYEAVKGNFFASYFIVDRGRDQLMRNLLKEENFSKVYEDKDGLIFKLR